jgi:hypothetical protein
MTFIGSLSIVKSDKLYSKLGQNNNWLSLKIAFENTIGRVLRSGIERTTATANGWRIVQSKRWNTFLQYGDSFKSK